MRVSPSKNRIAKNRIERPLSTALNHVFIKCCDIQGFVADSACSEISESPTVVSIPVCAFAVAGARFIPGTEDGLKCASSRKIDT